MRPAPGHTPGHVVLQLPDGGEKAMFCGDVCHHPIQVHEPDWNTRFCEIPEQARLTRRQVLDIAPSMTRGCSRRISQHLMPPELSVKPNGFGVEFVPARSDRS